MIEWAFLIIKRWKLRREARRLMAMNAEIDALRVELFR
jgi:hypothetical protein